VAAVQHTFTHKQYTEQQNEKEYTEQNYFQVRRPLCVLYDEYKWYKIIKLYSHTQLSIYYYKY